MSLLTFVNIDFRIYQAAILLGESLPATRAQYEIIIEFQLRNSNDTDAAEVEPAAAAVTLHHHLPHPRLLADAVKLSGTLLANKHSIFRVRHQRLLLCFGRVGGDIGAVEDGVKFEKGVLIYFKDVRDRLVDVFRDESENRRRALNFALEEFLPRGDILLDDEASLSFFKSDAVEELRYSVEL